jgi:hypothetical protein
MGTSLSYITVRVGLISAQFTLFIYLVVSIPWVNISITYEYLIS